jgi:NitT/TauT family transport system ATP-binding protein/sulfonate transport system ATP-binding protein
MARGPGLSLHIGEKRFTGSAAPLFSELRLDVAPGSVVAILGASGVGKSTLLRLVAGIDREFSGAITIDGRPAEEAPPPGFVFQDARLLPWLTAAGNLRLAAPGLDGAETQRLLEQVGLLGAAELYPRQLSGGMQRRLALARALAPGGRLLLLDEPFVSLDRALADEMHQVLCEVFASSEASVLLVTHDPLDAARLADRVLVLGGRPARIVRDEVFAAPRGQRDESLVGEYARQIGS